MQAPQDLAAQHVAGQLLGKLRGGTADRPRFWAVAFGPASGREVVTDRAIKAWQSWAHPGSNYTGMSYLAIELVGKRIELLKEWLPQIQRIAVLARPQHPGEHLERQASEAVVGKLGMEFSYFPYYSQSVLPARDLGELETTFRAIAQDRCDALVVFPDAAMYEVSGRIAQFALDAGAHGQPGSGGTELSTPPSWSSMESVSFIGAVLLRVSNFVQTPSMDRRIFPMGGRS